MVESSANQNQVHWGTLLGGRIVTQSETTLRIFSFFVLSPQGETHCFVIHDLHDNWEEYLLLQQTPPATMGTQARDAYQLIVQIIVLYTKGWPISSGAIFSGLWVLATQYRI